MALKEYLIEHMETWARLGHPAPLERFVLRNGKEYKPTKRIGRKGKPKNCFRNAATAVFKSEFTDKPLTYVEGFTINKELPIPIHHAWVTTDGTDAMDPTLDAETHEYFGVEIKTTDLRKEIVRNGVYGVLDPGLGINIEWMFKVDPGLEAEIKAVKGDAKLMKLMEANK